MFKVNNKDTRTTLEQRRSGVFIVNFGVVMVSLLLTLIIFNTMF